MRKMYKILLAIIIVSSISFTASAQEKYWSPRSDNSGVTTDKAVARISFPKEFKLFNLNINPIRQELFSVVGNQSRHSTIVTLPNAEGNMEQFEVVEASNFDPALQARFPEIRAFSGKGITDRSAMLKLSISPQGLQTMIFRTGIANEYIEPYSSDHSVYAVFKSQRVKGGLPWVCSTPDQEMAANIQAAVSRVESNTGQLKTMRLAQSCNAEYSNWFGATSSAQVGLVLAAFNATLTRCNGCYEKDLALHLNLIPTTDLVIYYNPATDPYTAMGSWNGQLQATLTSVIGEANYDIGHMFGASGGGGNAGCIGCVCVDGQKGSGITSPADGIPQGDNFDIDYVAHEVGHQMGGNHTWSYGSQSGLQPVEVGSGITIMGYAGITNVDVAPHSIDIFHERSIQQIQLNMAGKACPITTSLAGTNATPVVASVSNYTIPITTPFALTGSATDADAGDVLTYCWEQNDNATTLSEAASIANPTKTNGPNWLTFPATTSSTKLFPRLSTILTGASVTGPLPGGTSGVNIEALSSVGRTLNFRLTVRDNSPYSSTAPVKVGQTQFTDMVVTVDATTGPFLITTQNSAVSYPASSAQTVTWSVNGTTGAPINCANVKISFSTDGGVTFPTILAASTPNDGSELFTVPSTLTTTGRIKVEAIGNIFFDINNANISITPPLTGFSFGTTTPTTSACPAAATLNVSLPIISNSGYIDPVTLSAIAGVPAGTTITFGTNPVVPGNSSVVTLNAANTLAPGTYNVTIQGTGPAPAITLTTTVTFTINPGTGPTINTQPANQTVCVGGTANFSVTATGATGYQWQYSTNSGGTWTNVAGAISATYAFPGAIAANNGWQFRVIVTGQCGSTTSGAATLTVNVAPVITTNPSPVTICSGSAISFTAAASGTPAPTYQWQVSTIAVPAFTDISGEISATLNIASVTAGMNGNQYRCVATNSCSSVNTTAALLTVNSSISVTTSPTSQTICEGTNVSFTTLASGGVGLTYTWEVSTNGGTSYTAVNNGGVYSGATSATLTLTAVPPGYNTYRYRAIASNGVCTPGISTAAILTVNTFPSITAAPQNITICEGANTTFNVTATTGVGTLTYQWQFSPDGVVAYSNITGATASSFTQTAVPATQNGYRYRVIATAGCGSVTSASAISTVNKYPVISFSVPSPVCKSDQAFALSASPSGGTFSGTGVSSGEFTPTAAGVGAKVVTYTATNAGCTAAVSKTIVVNECAERHITLDKKPAIVVYPNPNNGAFSIGVKTDLYSTLNIKIYNTRGQEVSSQNGVNVYYGSMIPLNLFNIPSGTYLVFISGNANGQMHKRGDRVIIYK